MRKVGKRVIYAQALLGLLVLIYSLRNLTTFRPKQNDWNSQPLEIVKATATATAVENIDIVNNNNNLDTATITEATTDTDTVVVNTTTTTSLKTIGRDEWYQNTENSTTSKNASSPASSSANILHPPSNNETNKTAIGTSTTSTPPVEYQTHHNNVSEILMKEQPVPSATSSSSPWYHYIAPRQYSLPDIILHDNKSANVNGSNNVLSLAKTLELLQDLGSHDHYDGSNLICTTPPTGDATKYPIPEIYWYDYRQQQQQQGHGQEQTTIVSTNTTTANSTHPRVLIVQSAGFGTYGALLDKTVPINKAYARKWNMTLLIIQGSLVVTNGEKDRNCHPPEHRSTHNKMQMLQFAANVLQKQTNLYEQDDSNSNSSSSSSSSLLFDYMLLLDADAFLYDFDVDVSTLLPSSSLLAADRLGKKRATWKINAGVTLWNLHHVNLSTLAIQWQKAALGYLNGRNNDSGDQIFLYHTLKANNFTLQSNVWSLEHEFKYNKGTVIKHVKRPKVTYQIGKTKIDQRISIIDKFTKEICMKFPNDCEVMDYFNYSQVEPRFG